MKEFKNTKTYFGHLSFYYEPNSFIFPISAIIDNGGIVLCFGFWGMVWTFKKDVNPVVTFEMQAGKMMI